MDLLPFLKKINGHEKYLVCVNNLNLYLCSKEFGFPVLWVGACFFYSDFLKIHPVVPPENNIFKSCLS